MLTRRTFRIVIFSLAAAALTTTGLAGAVAAPLRATTVKAATSTLAKTWEAVGREFWQSKPTAPARAMPFTAVKATAAASKFDAIYGAIYDWWQAKRTAPPIDISNTAAADLMIQSTHNSPALAMPLPRDDDYFAKSLLYCGGGTTAVAGVNEATDQLLSRAAAPYFGTACFTARGLVATTPIVRKPRMIGMTTDHPLVDQNPLRSRNQGCPALC